MNLFLLIILFAFNFALIYGVNKMYNNGMLDLKQYRFYVLLLIICLLFFIGQIGTLNN